MITGVIWLRFNIVRSTSTWCNLTQLDVEQQSNDYQFTSTVSQTAQNQCRIVAVTTICVYTIYRHITSPLKQTHGWVEEATICVMGYNAIGRSLCPRFGRVAWTNKHTQKQINAQILSISCAGRSKLRSANLYQLHVPWTRTICGDQSSLECEPVYQMTCIHWTFSKRN